MRKIHRYYYYPLVLVSIIFFTDKLQELLKTRSCPFVFFLKCLSTKYILRRSSKIRNIATKLRCFCIFLFLNCCRILSDNLLTYKKKNKAAGEGNPLYH